MHNKLSLAAVVVLLVVTLFISFGFTPSNNVVEAQDGPIVCDWTLITLLYIAEHDYGYFPATDVSNFEFGQYTPLFDAMMAGMEMEETEEPEMAETEEPEMEETEEPLFPFLDHGDIEGEPEECVALRHELDAWFLDHFMAEMEE